MIARVLQVFHELLDALHNACSDDSHVLLLTGSGNTFCSGVDLHYLLTECSDRPTAAKTMSDSLRSEIIIVVVMTSVIFVNENENYQKRKNNDSVNEN